MADNTQAPQSNVKPEYNTATTGLNLDQSVSQIPKGKLSYALNAAVENFDANSVNYQNESGNELCLQFPTDYQLIGKHLIAEKNKHIFFLANPITGNSQIGYMDNNDCIYRIYIEAPCLNFNIHYPIPKIVHKITNCTTEIYWTDGINPRRYLDLDNIPRILKPGSTLCDPIYSDEVDCNQLKLQPNFEIPLLEVTDITNGGALLAGTYQFTIQYSDAIGNPYTSYYSVTNPTPIANTHIITTSFNYEVGKSIVLNITNLDITGQFQYFNLAVIKTINDIASVELIGTYFIDRSNRQITYTGQNQTQINLTINDVFEKYPFYEIAQDITTVQDILVWDNLTSIDRINYQQIANEISFNWQTHRIPSTETYADELNATNLRGYLRDEVYAFEIVFMLKNGKQTDGFHIPGRAIGYNEISQLDVPVTNPDFIGEPDPITNSSPYWKIYNTGSVTGYSPEYIPGDASYKGPYQYGQFAYWESIETYPCNVEIWGELADQPIRHHKFPDVRVSPIFETPLITKNSDGTYRPVMIDDAIFPMGVMINIQQIGQLIAQSNLTNEQKANISAFKIVRGDRATNKSIVAKGILRNVGKYTRDKINDPDSTYYYYPNYPYNDLKEDVFLLEQNNAYNSQCNTYTVTATATGFIEYTDCNTNILVRKNVVSGDVFSQCSITVPVSSVATSVLLSSPTNYTLTVEGVGGWISFQYADCITGSNVGVIVYTGAPRNICAASTYSTPLPKVLFQNPNVTSYSIVNNSPSINITCYPAPLNGFVIDNDPLKDIRYRQIFNSPETSFGNPVLGNVLKLESAIFGAGKAHFVEVRKNALYKLLSLDAQQDAMNSSFDIANITAPYDVNVLFTAYQTYLQIYLTGIPRRNYAYSFNSIANYSYNADIDNNLGIKQRELDYCQYLIPGFQSVGESISINNYQRESSVYLKTMSSRFGNPYTALPFPSQTPSLISSGTNSYITDNSRFTISQKNDCAFPTKQEDITVVSYYASLKNDFVNQWGQIYSYPTIDTGFQRNIETNNILMGQPSIATIFGGDTFINRFAFKTKIPFFIDNRVGAPDDSDIFYDEIGNVGFPKYWFSSRSVLTNYKNLAASPHINLQNFFSTKAHNFDCPNSQLPKPSPTSVPPIVNSNRTYYDGKMYMFAYGIPNFYCESSINVDLRQAFNNKDGDFFPRVSTTIPDDWVQESYVSIAFDNTYTYNITYSKQNKENFFSHLPTDWKAQLCFTNFPFKAIYSDEQSSDPSNKVNNWLSYGALSYFDFPQNFGKLTSLDGIQNKAVLARFENKSLLYNTMLTIQTSNPQAAYLGNSTLFKAAPPIDFAETDLGYVGSQNKFLLKIPQGQITIDAKRGQVFLIAGNQATDLSGFGSGLNRFFTDHLAFEILRYFPDVDADNNFTGIGLHGVYDSKYDRVIISKLDYIPLDKDIKYDSLTREFYINRTYHQNSTISIPCIEYTVRGPDDLGDFSCTYLNCDANPITIPIAPDECIVIFALENSIITTPFVTVELGNTCGGTTTTTTSTTSTPRDPLVVREIVYLTDEKYFCNKSWTLSYNVNTQSWISFHSYIPNFYIGENNFFYSGLNGGCDLELIAATEIPSTTTTTTTFCLGCRPPEPTTTTTTTTIDCGLVGTALEEFCTIEGTAFDITPTTTTTTTTSGPTGTLELHIVPGGGGTATFTNTDTATPYSLLAIDTFASITVPLGNYTYDGFTMLLTCDDGYEQTSTPSVPQTFLLTTTYSVSIDCALTTTTTTTTAAP